MHSIWLEPDQGEEFIIKTFEGKKEYYSKMIPEKVDETKTDEKSKPTAFLTSGPEAIVLARVISSMCLKRTSLKWKEMAGGRNHS